jgi:ABC-type branched-subunit amino acid transport system ATPase component/branched-subunit amino acid ABC-type transport system permease component
MQEAIRFALLGLGTGALYALAAQGLIVIYRGSGVLNFAQGAIGMAGAYLDWWLTTTHGWASVPALIAGVLLSALIGALTHLVIMRQLRRASPLARVIATLGVLLSLQAGAILLFSSVPQFITSALPSTVVHIHGQIVISEDRLILLGIAAGLTVLLWGLYRYSRFGLGTAAVAENERAAASLGWSPDVVATANWTLGSALAGLAAILIAPIVTLQPAVMTDLVIAAIAGALVAAFRSFPIAFFVSLAIGIAEAEITRYSTQPGLTATVPFIVIVIVLVVSGRALPLRDYFLQRLPSVGSGRIRWGWTAVGVAIAVLLLSTTSTSWTAAITVWFSVALVLLSIVVVTGYAGQLSLAQFALAGFGAYVAGRLVASQGTPFWLAALIGIAATILVGLVFALPAIRTRGINLAVVTLGLGVALEATLFDNTNYTGGIEGTLVGNTNLFGWDISSITHPARYGIVVVVCYVLAALVVSNIRRGRSGRRLIATRTNERAAAALGISVPVAKLYAFAVSAGIAAVGGILIGFQLTTIDYTIYTHFTSLTFVGLALIGGIGYLAGPVIGATLAAGSLDQQILNSISSGIGKYIDLIAGISIIVLVLLNQDGIARETISQIRWVTGRLPIPRLPIPRLRPRARRPKTLPVTEIERVPPKTLEVRDVTVRYGAVTAVDSVSLGVRPGKITGLIGPNGAGKTTLIDVIGGFTPTSGGNVAIDGTDISGWSPVRRARAGLGRSFQSLELFEDSSVLDNLRTASDAHDALSYVRDLLYPINPPLPSEAVSASTEFGLENDLDRLVQDLPYGRRRLLAIARAVASQPSILLLDEPAAGLGDVETRELAHLVKRLASEWGLGVLLVEHDINFVMAVCDEIVVLDFGRKISEGSPEKVRNDPAVIAAYLGEAEQEAAPHGEVQPSAIDGGGSGEIGAEGS